MIAGGVTLTPREVLLAAVAVRLVLLRYRSNGQPPPAGMAALSEGLEAAAAVMPRQRHDDAAEPLPGRDWLCSAQVAEHLGLSVRQVQRMAGRLGGQRIGRAWAFPPERVRLEAADRRAA